MRYYLMYPDHSKIVVRGNPKDTLSYEWFDKAAGKWKRDFDLWWKIEAGDFINFKEISEQDFKLMIGN